MSEGDGDLRGRGGAGERLLAGRYRLVRVIGRGGMGLVWLAEDEMLGRQVAVKELRPPGGLTDADVRVQQSRALREARNAARIEHSGAVRLYEVIPATAHDEAVYLIMELVEGRTLGEAIADGGPLPAPRVAGYGLQLLDALEAAHALGIVHRDVKPGNIIIAGGDRAMLADFGIAHNVGDPRLTTSGVMGTQAYLAPELFDRGPVTPTADLWSLGATLYAAAEGVGPFDRDTTGATLRAILLDDPPVPRCEPGLATVITSLMRRDPAERATIAEARAGLRPVAARQPTGPEPASPLPATPTPASRPGTSPAREPRLAWDPTAATGLQPRAPLPEPADVPAKPGFFAGTRHRFADLVGRVGRRTIIATVAVAVVIAAAVVGFLGGRSTGNHTLGARPSGGASPSQSQAQAEGQSGGVLKLRSTITLPADDTGHHITFSPDGTTLALYGWPGTGEATLWSAADGRMITTLPFGTGNSDVAFSPNGQLLAVTERGGGIGLWDIATRKVTTNLNDPDTATGVAFSPNGQLLAVADLAGVRLWDVASRTWIGPLPNAGGSSARRIVMFSPNGATLAVADSGTGDVDVWDVGSRSFIGVVPSPGHDPFGLGSWISFRADSSALAIGSPVSAGAFTGVRLWNISARTVTTTMVNMGVDGVNALAFSRADDDALAVGGDGVIVWDVKTYNPITAQPDPDNAEIADVTFSPDGGTLATLSSHERIYLWQVAGLG
jgi:tRNA A-37 threonylcarbamoyl transferase component Bud32